MGVGNNRFVFQAPAIVEITMTLSWPTNSTGYRQINALINGAQREGAPYDRRDAVASGGTFTTVSSSVVVAAGDVVGINVLQTSGGALNTAGGPTTENFRVEVIKWL